MIYDMLGSDTLLSQGEIIDERRCRIHMPYREHLAHHFPSIYARIGLPEPYSTQPTG